MKTPLTIQCVCGLVFRCLPLPTDWPLHTVRFVSRSFTSGNSYYYCQSHDFEYVVNLTKEPK